MRCLTQSLNTATPANHWIASFLIYRTLQLEFPAPVASPDTNPPTLQIQAIYKHSCCSISSSLLMCIYIPALFMFICNFMHPFSWFSTLTVECKPFDSPRELTSLVLVGAYIPPDANAATAISELSEQVSDVRKLSPRLPGSCVMRFQPHFSLQRAS